MIVEWDAAINRVRDKVWVARAQKKKVIPLIVNLPNGLAFQYSDITDQQKTNENQRILTYNMKANSIYPD
jgi:hypothetical protein